MWLWNHDDEPFVYYAVGGRVHEFVGYHHDAQFAPEAKRLAIRAADEIDRLRSQFRDIESTASYLVARVEDERDAFDAAVASALAGETDRARALFDHHDSLCRKYHERDRDEDWYSDELWEEHEADLARSDAFRFSLDDPEEFRRHVDGAIARVREGLRLPPLH
jgi:hypothetical protein